MEIAVMGPWTFDYAKKVVDQIKEIVSKGVIKKVLLDLSKGIKPEDEMIRFWSGKYLAENVSGNVKIAAFTQEKDITRFGETAAINRGSLFRVFSDREKAKEWLLEK
ncbi:MAG TPA: hypothetical protein VLX68_08255 [Chitinivibrionales bacterium]|nr:hypothetical protein [Chitinivibrionales bacterium]